MFIILKKIYILKTKLLYEGFGVEFQEMLIKLKIQIKINGENKFNSFGVIYN